MAACHYDLAFVTIDFLYGNGAAYPKEFNKERLRTFTINGAPASLNSTAYAYVPQRCESKKCPVHMVLHGCGQSVGLIGTRFIEYSGYNDVAEANDIIILYPQVLNTTTNPDACWDFKGYTGNDYLTKEAV